MKAAQLLGNLRKMYIIIWNHTSNDAHINLNYHRFIEVYTDYEDAVSDAEEIQDKTDFREYVIVKQVEN